MEMLGRMCGYHTTLENVQSLIVDARKVWDASKKDDDSKLTNLCICKL